MLGPLLYFGYGALLSAVVLVLIAIIIAIAVVAARRYENYLSGLWVGDPAFLKEGQLRDFRIFLAPREEGCRQGYLIITADDGTFVANQAIEVREGALWWSSLRSTFRSENDQCKTRRFEVEYDGAEEGEDPPMPELLKMSLSILEGTLTLYDGEKIYAFMHKDPGASAAALAAYGAPSAEKGTPPAEKGTPPAEKGARAK